MFRFIVFISFLLRVIIIQSQEFQSEYGSIKHCLLADTKITMNDDSMKDISEIKEGDFVLSYNNETGEYEEAEVKKVHSLMHNRYSRITIKSGAYIEVTADQPFWTAKGWVSMSPMMTNSYERYEGVKIGNLDESTKLLYYDITDTNESEIKSIDGFIEIIQAYSLELDNDGAYIANSFLVGQE